MSESVRVRCEYPGCTKVARVMNEGGFWCHHPHVGDQPEPSPIPDRSTYFDVLRSMDPSPTLLAAIEKAETERTEP